MYVLYWFQRWLLGKDIRLWCDALQFSSFDVFADRTALAKFLWTHLCCQNGQVKQSNPWFSVSISNYYYLQLRVWTLWSWTHFKVAVFISPSLLRYYFLLQFVNIFYLSLIHWCHSTYKHSGPAKSQVGHWDHAMILITTAVYCDINSLSEYTSRMNVGIFTIHQILEFKGTEKIIICKNMIRVRRLNQSRGDQEEIHCAS